MKLICVICWKGIKNKRSNSKVCALECMKVLKRRIANAYYQKNKPKTKRNQVLNCLVCGKENQQRSANAKTCSQQCSKVNFKNNLAKAIRKYFLKNKETLQRKNRERYWIKKAINNKLIFERREGK